MASNYVLGFLFSPWLDRVVLIRKERPAWQNGLLNGIGGHIEPGENPAEAMAREFHEEAGLRLEDWKPVGELKAEGRFSIHLFGACRTEFDKVETMTDEWVRIYPVDEIVSGAHHTVANIPWLVTMIRSMLNGKERCVYFNIEEKAWRAG